MEGDEGPPHAMAYVVKFWGTRGSIPTPGRETTRYGGNTPCVALRQHGTRGEQIVILDAGTGVRPLGLDLMGNGSGPLSIDILVSHTHWDHIQGLPFFAPFFGRGNAIRIWGPKQDATDLEAILRDQMNPVVFPVPLDELAAELSVAHIGGGEFEINGFGVQAMRMRHPGHTLGYRLTPLDGGGTVGYATDNELGPGGDYDVGASWRREFVAFLRGVDVLVHDGMYWPEEAKRFPGWGHSSNLEAVELAVEAEVERLVLFHHRPEHDDATVDAMLAQARAAAEAVGSGLQVLAAHEGMEIVL